MAETMRVDTTALRAAEPALETLSATAGIVLSRLTAVLDGEGPCWGGDSTGTTFAGGYVPAAQQIREALALLGDVFRDVRIAVLEVADNVDAAEGRARQRLR